MKKLPGRKFLIKPFRGGEIRYKNASKMKISAKLRKITKSGKELITNG